MSFLVGIGPDTYLPAMKSILALFALSLLSLSAQVDQGPKLKVPKYIAKVPERSDFVGEWLRQDGTYKLTVAIDKGGDVTANYFNPKPIKVESATFTGEGQKTILTIVLRDEGYPGSTYQLGYNSSYLILAGKYLMPQQKQQHDVYFTVAKPDVKK
ncbi:MAG: hypothetical protein ACPGVU_11540 [Limisphaerales bacterium]